MVNTHSNGAPRGREHGMATEKKRDLVLIAKEIQKNIDGCLKQAGEA